MAGTWPVQKIAQDPFLEHPDDLAGKYRVWADEAWQVLLPDLPFEATSEQYHQGFVQGFVDFVKGDEQSTPPPSVNAMRSGNVGDPRGSVALQEWRDGYEHGTRLARDHGYRLRAMELIPPAGTHTSEAPPQIAMATTKEEHELEPGPTSWHPTDELLPGLTNPQTPIGPIVNTVYVDYFDDTDPIPPKQSERTDTSIAARSQRQGPSSPSLGEPEPEPPIEALHAMHPSTSVDSVQAMISATIPAYEGEPLDVPLLSGEEPALPSAAERSGFFDHVFLDDLASPSRVENRPVPDHGSTLHGLFRHPDATAGNRVLNRHSQRFQQ